MNNRMIEEINDSRMIKWVNAIVDNTMNEWQYK